MSETVTEKMKYSAKHKPTYGFIGRENDISIIEKKLQEHNILLLTGMAGAGKTALLDLMGEKLEESGAVKKSFYFGFDETLFTAEQITDVLGKSILEDREFISFINSNSTGRRNMVLDRLNRETYCLILDNCDFITSASFIPVTDYEIGTGNEIAGFVKELSGGRTLVAIGSRSGECWREAAGDEYHLEGLDEKGSRELAGRISERIKMEIVADDEDFSKLIKLLNGNPLGMEMILPCLPEKDSSDILKSLTDAGIGLKADGDDRTEDVIKLMEYSFYSLSPESRRLLLLFAPFRSVINMHFVENYINELGKFPSFEGITVQSFFSITQDSFNRGFIESVNSGTSMIGMQPLFRYFIEREMNESMSAEDRESLMQVFLNHYYGVTGVMVKFFQSDKPGALEYARNIAMREYANIIHALNFALDGKESVLLLYVCLDSYFDSLKDHDRGLKVGRYILDSLEKYPAHLLKGKMGNELVSVMDSIAYRLFVTGKYEEARDLYLKVLEIHDELPATDENHKKKKSAGMLHQLGMANQRLGEYDEARKFYNRALEIYTECSDRYKQAKEYSFLGETAFLLENYKEACNDYQNALRIFGEFGDNDSLAHVHLKMASALEGAEDFEGAMKHCEETLMISEAMEDRSEEAATCFRMGMLSHKMGYLPEASDHYYRAMNTYIDFGDMEGQAKTYRELGRINGELMNYDESGDHYRKSAEIYEELNLCEEADMMREELMKLESREE